MNTCIQWTQEYPVSLLCALGILIWIDWCLIHLIWTGKIKRARIPSPLFSWDAWKTELALEYTNFEIAVSTIIAPIRPLLIIIGVLTIVVGAIVAFAFFLSTGLWFVFLPTEILLIGYILKMTQ